MKYLNVKLYLPLLEVPIENSAWKSFPANSDALKHTITAQLMDNQVVFHDSYDGSNKLIHVVLQDTYNIKKIRGLPGVFVSFGIKHRTK